jgi:FtsH-binding integral membrane protein
MESDLGFVCLVSYIGTMIFIADIQEQVSVALGEVVSYSPFVDVSVTQVFEGYVEGGQVRFIPDVPLWITSAILTATLYHIRKRFAEG